MPVSQREASRQRMRGNTFGYTSFLGRRHTVVTRRRIAAAQRARREVISQQLQTRWRDNPSPVWLKRTYHLTSLALDLAAFLLSAGYELVPEVRFGRYCIDLYEPTRHLAFEADGDYWHGLPGRREHDQRRDRELFKRYGLPVVRFTEDEIKVFRSNAQGV